MTRPQYADLPLADALRCYASEHIDPFTFAIHTARYGFARNLLPASGGAEVLDIGCAYGFGAVILAERAAHVTGLDAHAEVIGVARERFAQPNIQYETGDCLERAYPEGVFDLITAFEVIEHLEDPGVMLAKCVRWLRPGGIFVGSTPNKLVHLLMGIVWAFHEKEYGYSELWSLLREHFPESSIEVLGQNPHMLEHWRTRQGRFKPYATSLRRLVWITTPRPLIAALRRVFPKRLPRVSPNDPVLQQAITISAENVDLCDTFIAVARKPAGKQDSGAAEKPVFEK